MDLVVRPWTCTRLYKLCTCVLVYAQKLVLSYTSNSNLLEPIQQSSYTPVETPSWTLYTPVDIHEGQWMLHSQTFCLPSKRLYGRFACKNDQIQGKGVWWVYFYVTLSSWFHWLHSLFSKKALSWTTKMFFSKKEITICVGLSFFGWNASNLRI